MDTLLNSLVEFVTASGGTVAYPQALEHLGLERNKMPALIKMGKANGSLRRKLVWDAEAGESTLFLTTLEV